MCHTVPPTRLCLEYLRNHRFDDGVTCPRCDGRDVSRKGTTGKGAQRYRCRDCLSYFNDLTGTVFANQRLSLGEMFYIIARMDRQTVTGITADLDRTYKTVLRFVHKVRADSEAQSIVAAIRDDPDLDRLDVAAVSA